jgi:hypothetical protein
VLQGVGSDLRSRSARRLEMAGPGG